MSREMEVWWRGVLADQIRRRGELYCEMRQRLIIEFGRTDALYWRDLWRYRELFGVLAWRDLSVRYKETVFGVLWALIRPFLTMLVFTTIFGRLAKFPSDGNIPYPLMVLVGMILWTLFSTSWTELGSSLVRDASLITKVYFPRMIVPTASMAVNYVDFLISFALLVMLMFWYRFMPGWQIVLLPVFMAHRVFGQPGTRSLDCRAKRQISGFPLYRPFYRAIRPVRFAGRFQLERNSR